MGAAMLKEPLPQEEIARSSSSPLSLVMSSTPPTNMVSTTVPAMTNTITTTSSNRSSPNSSPISSPAPPVLSGGKPDTPPPPVIPSVTSTPSINAIPSLPPGFTPPHGLPFGLLRHHLTGNPLTGLPTPTSSPQSLMSPNPFLPPGIMIPGMP